MGLSEILTLAGGLALFLIGMDSMGKGLETACGNKMKAILKKLTSNRFVAVLVGAAITAVIQSSSATTVMVVGFVNAGMMTLSQAVWIIMGANIGTTITGLLIALDIGMIAPAFAIIGAVMMIFIKKPLVNEIGKILAGFGILFIGMDMMSAAMMPLRESEFFIGLMTKFSNPFLGILVGMVFTAIIQSSSASVGILQALAMAGAIKLDSAVFILFGQNIGTCVTALLASISANRNAKRTTLIHFMFNIIGTVLFTLICVVTPLVDFMKEIIEEPAMQIATMHTVFNITTSLLLIPFGLYLVKLTELILPDKIEKEENVFMYINHDLDVSLGNSAILIENIKREIERMYDISSKNILLGLDDILNKNNNHRDEIVANEDLVDKLNDGITRYITLSLPHEANKKESEIYGAYLNISSNIERLSDHAQNLSDTAEEIYSGNIKLSDAVYKELGELSVALKDMLNNAMLAEKFVEVELLESKIDDLTEDYRKNMFERLKASSCSADGSILYSTLLINLERIGDHLLNVSEKIREV